MRRFKKAALAASLLLGVQQAFPLLAMAEISVKPLEGNPYVFAVMDSEYGNEEYELKVESYYGEDQMHEEVSPDNPSEPFLLAIDPATWVPYFDLDNPHPVTFRVSTLRKDDQSTVDTVDYEWSMVSTVKGSVPVSPELASRMSLTLTPDAGEETTVSFGNDELSYDSSDQSLHFAMNTMGSGPYTISAEVEGQPFGSLVVKPDDSNRTPRETQVVEEGGENKVHTYFDVQAGTLYPYTYNDQVEYEDWDAASDGTAAQITRTSSGERDVANVELPFNFRFYNNIYHQITVSPMGALYFGDRDYDTMYMDEYPDFESPPALYPYLGNMEIKSGDERSGIYTQIVGQPGDRKFIIQWNHMYYVGVDAPVTFQAILYEKSGNIHFQYPQIEMDGVGGGRYDNGASATIGIQDQGDHHSANYVLYSQNESSVMTGQAICFGSRPLCSGTEPVQKFSVTYDSNGSLQGSVPVDPLTYEADAEVIVLGNRGELSMEGYSFAGWNTQADGKGTNYLEGNKFQMKDGNVKLYAHWIKKDTGNPGGGGSGGSGGTAGNGEGSSSGSGGGTGTVGTPSSGGNGTTVPVRVTVGDKTYDQVVTTGTKTENGQAVVTAHIDTAAIQSLLASAGNQPTVSIPVTQNADRFVMELNGEALQALQDKHAILEFVTPRGIIRLPADAISKTQLTEGYGAGLNLSELVIRLGVSKADKAQEEPLDMKAKEQGFDVVLPAGEFTVNAVYKGKPLALKSFGSYVQQIIDIPDKVDAGRITTGVMVEEDGSIHPVPTYITERSGQKAAVISSLTSGWVALISHPKTFADLEGSWAQNIVNDMASRLIIQGTDDTHFIPAKAITRGEFASAMVRALGIADNGKNSSYTDMSPANPYTGAVTQAKEFGLITGYEDGTFRPDNTITREEAMVLLNRAMKLTGLNTHVSNANDVLAGFADKGSIHSWAMDAIANAVQSKLMQGANAELQPQSSITKAETAAVLQRLLLQAGLIR
ncbi:hypothetical protein J23TS9_36700 [Paenibacillus sp. J23TS9]|uniref:S-layer homology domain-containing protein n=1 Tax=Paenibacillus sp. J23TS9 TaxID=2807193 RepID=UPI001B0E3598|nr:S-layer homology domain-containing protein [Paenibacillus sp. J23TS9]GIP28540.1 hypothetical protein J23TS9_36700 [Paenibacillus sp. J23TS9]